MGWLEHYPRSYYKNYDRVEVKNDCGWYEVYKLPQDVYAICEPQHFQEVNTFLIIGSERALLLDTGQGICPIKPLIDELYDGEIITVNSHFHFDHIGQNYLFEPVYIFDDDYAKAVARSGLKKETLGAQMNPEMFQFGYPEHFDPEHFEIKPYEVKTMADGDTFNLGNRSLQVLHTPGHCNDAIMLYDAANKILFTGDTFYLGALYTHFDCDEFGEGNVRDYYNTMRTLDANIPADVSLYCSHNDFIADRTKINEVAEALARIMEHANEDVALGHMYLEEGNPVAELQYDGFSIVYKK